VLAVCYGTLPVTRDDLGEFLIARGGYEKLDLLVNRKIIDAEAARANVTVTPEEVEAAFAADLKGLGVTKDDFVKVVLPKYGKSLHEWTEDAIRPRLALGKMCRAGVAVTDDDLQKAFENKYGEKRQAKVILWGKGEVRQAQKQWDEARKGDDEFDRVAKAQKDVTLAAAAGLTAPVGRHVDAENTSLERILFTLKVGEVSQLFETPAGIMCVKCAAVLPPQQDKTLAQVKPDLEREVFERKLAKAVPEFFTKLREAARPELLLKGPPTERENREGVDQLIRDAGLVPTKKP
jgi:parvulin-like peptidyl-prolyl isomerase